MGTGRQRSEGAREVGGLDVVAALRLNRCLRHLDGPPAERIAHHFGEHAADEAHELLWALSRLWPDPPVALTGSTARMAWPPERVRPAATGLDLAPLRSTGDAAAFLSRIGAVARAGSDIFDLGGLIVRLRPSPPPSASLVRWRRGAPVRAVAVTRPEWMPGMVVERHAVRAVLTAARRDNRGRRYPPYHETLGVAVRPVWFESGSFEAG